MESKELSLDEILQLGRKVTNWEKVLDKLRKYSYEGWIEDLQLIVSYEYRIEECNPHLYSAADVHKEIYGISAVIDGFDMGEFEYRDTIKGSFGVDDLFDFVAPGYKQTLLNKQEIRVKEFYEFVKRKHERDEIKKEKAKERSALKKAKDLLK